jgi:hypothetical protein
MYSRLYSISTNDILYSTQLNKNLASQDFLKSVVVWTYSGIYLTWWIRFCDTHANSFLLRRLMTLAYYKPFTYQK